MLGRDALARPFTTIIVTFATWKLFLLAIAAGSSSVGDAYDTSASLALELAANATTASASLLTRLSSWDAIYFLGQVQRGYLFEQEYAFASGPPAVMTWLVKGLIVLGFGNESQAVSADAARRLLAPLAGVLMSHAAHLLSALALYRLGRLVWGKEEKGNRAVALAGALLHVFTPGGMFLSAPYAESGFALLTFAGYWAFAKGICAEEDQQRLSLLRRDGYRLVAGILFGLATAFRSNGLLNGIPFAWAFLQAMVELSRRPAAAIIELAVLGVGGVCVAAGSIIPQAVAYTRFCRVPGEGLLGIPSADPRPWCSELLPSIYTFVQARYWDVGFLRYWKLSNLPLFLLAAPMLFVLLRSGLEFLAPGGQQLVPLRGARKTSSRMIALVQCMAVAQVLLALLAITNYHVQVITRLASGSPAWYWWLAGQLNDREKSGLGDGITMFMVMYASIQGALFAFFLPPA